MSSIFSLQCLFCKHLNPSGAIFCNECGTQLNMQPCEQCGAIDARDAKNCHKCGAEFPLPAKLEPDTVPAPGIQTQKAAPNGASSGAGWRRSWLVAAVALIAGLVYAYFHDGQPVRVAQKQGVKQLAPDVSGGPNLVQPTPLTLSAQTDVELTQTGVATKPATGIGGLDTAPTPTPAPAPATEAAVNSPKPPSILRDCPQAVATLGLCSPDTKSENQ